MTFEHHHHQRPDVDARSDACSRHTPDGGQSRSPLTQAPDAEYLRTLGQHDRALRLAEVAGLSMPNGAANKVRGHAIRLAIVLDAIIGHGQWHAAKLADAADKELLRPFLEGHAANLRPLLSRGNHLMKPSPDASTAAPSANERTINAGTSPR
jgi:hypothetical protein